MLVVGGLAAVIRFHLALARCAVLLAWIVGWGAAALWPVHSPDVFVSFLPAVLRFDKSIMFPAIYAFPTCLIYGVVSSLILGPVVDMLESLEARMMMWQDRSAIARRQGCGGHGLGTEPD